MTTGQRIAAKRRELELSQEGLGERLGVSRQSIYKWESDASLPEIDKLVALSRLFNVPVGWLLGVEEENAQGSDPLSEEQLRMVEEIFRRYQQEPRELSEEQRRQVEELVSKGASGKGKSPWDKWSVRILFAMCGAIIASVFTINAKVDNFQSQYANLSGSISNITNSVNGQIDSLTGRVEEVLKDQNSLLADYTVQLAGVDFQSNTVTFQLWAVPKTYTQGTEIQFLVQSAGETVESPGEANDQFLDAEITCSLTDSITISIVFLRDGVREIQILEQYEGLYSESFPYASMNAGFELWGLEGNEDGSFTLPPVQGFLSCSSTGAVWPLTSRSEAVSAQMGLFRNRQLVCWLEKSETNHSGHDVTPEHAAAVSGAEGVWPYYILPGMTLEAEEGDEIEFAALITDEYGRQFMCQDLGFVVRNGVLEYPENKAFSTDPADWTF